MQELRASQPIARARVLTTRGGVQSAVGEWRGQEVFVKTLLGASAEATLRFSHEGEIAASLDHPLVVPLLARTPRQLIFPYVPGRTLREVIEDGPIPVGAALCVVSGVLRAVGHLHGRGVTHHDLKPENVLLRDDRARGEAVRLIDFGMSHSRSLETDIHDGTRMGTPHFMAPEQFRGVRGDPRSDLYSVGVLLFDALAGHPPYEDALGWLVGLSDDLAPLPGPPEVHPVLRAALQRDPEDRPASAGEMLEVVAAAEEALGLPSPRPPHP